MQMISDATQLKHGVHSVFDDGAQDSISYVLTRGSYSEAVRLSYEGLVRIHQVKAGAAQWQLDTVLARLKEADACASISNGRYPGQPR